MSDPLANYAPCHGAFRDLGEATAEFASSQLCGIGEAEAARRLPMIKDALATMARTIAALNVDSNADHDVEDALRGFRTRGAEMGFMGARKPVTMIEAFKRHRLHETLELLDTVGHTQATVDYLAGLGVDPAIVAARCGRLVVVPGGHPLIADAAAKEDRRLPHVFAEVCDFDGEMPIDLAVWAIGRPDEWYAGHGSGVMLGHANVFAPDESPLQIWRDPESWLRAGCDGVVILRRREAWCGDLGRWQGYILAENLEHAQELNRDGAQFFDVANVGVRDAV